MSIVGNQVQFNPGTDFDELDPGDSATVLVNYTMQDDSGATSSSTLTITVNGANDDPVAVADTGSAGENETKSFDVLANDTDVDIADVPANFTVTAASVASTTGLSGSPTAAGSVSIVGSQVQFNPGTDFDELDPGDSATVLVNYTMQDDSGATSSSTLTITVNGANDDPVAVADTGSAGENETKSFDVLANDTDVDIDDVPVNFTVTTASVASTTGLSGSPAAAGSVSIVGNQVQFNPGTHFDELDPGDSATAVVNYTMRDDSGATSSSTLTITVTGANDGPVAVVDTGSAGENETKSFDVLANDTDVDIDDVPVNFTVTAASVASTTGLSGSPTAAGSVSIVGNQVQFNPGTDFDELDPGDSATVLVNYTMQDDSGATSSSTLTITVNGANDDPVAVADTGSAGENETKSFDVLANDTDVDIADVPANFTVTAASVASTTGLSGSPAAAGSVSIVGSQVQFNLGTDFDELDPGDSATVLVNYTMQDDSGATSSSTLTITVNGANDDPVAVADTGTAGENETKSFDVLANDTDVDIDDVPANFTVTGATVASTAGLTGSPAAAGTVSVAGNQVQFVPGTDFDELAVGENATVVINYTMQDDSGAVSASQLTITVTGANDGPVITGGPDTLALFETDSFRTGSGTLNVEDLDITDQVSVTRTLATGGSPASILGDPLAPTNAELLAMFTLSPGTPVDGTATSAPFTWNFHSGTEAFDYLGIGEVLTLNYTITATDTQGATTTENVTITITGTNDPPRAVNLDVNDVFEGGNSTLTGTIIEIDGTDDITVTIDWDDPNNPLVAVFDIGFITGPGAMQAGDVFTSRTPTDGTELTILSVDTTFRQVNFEVTHQYVNDGANPGNGVPVDTSTIDVEVTDGLATGTNEIDVEVSNIAPVSTIDPIEFNIDGDPSIVTGRFTGGNPLDSHVVTVDWGDGEVSTVDLPLIGDVSVGDVLPTSSADVSLEITGVDTATGEVAFRIERAYPEAGTYTVTVTISDRDGGESINTQIGTVPNSAVPFLSVFDQDGDRESGRNTGSELTIIIEPVNHDPRGIFTPETEKDSLRIVISGGSQKYGSNAIFSSLRIETLVDDLVVSEVFNLIEGGDSFFAVIGAFKLQDGSTLTIEGKDENGDPFYEAYRYNAENQSFEPIDYIEDLTTSDSD